MSQTMRQGMMNFLTAYKGKDKFFTSAYLSRISDADQCSLSSLLKRMTDEGVLERKRGIGPRGGYGYRLRVQI